MSLFFDQNLSRQLPRVLAEILPGCKHAWHVGLAEADDLAIWQFAVERRLAIVTYDSDYVALSRRLGQPPKVVHLTTGNLSRLAVAQMIRDRIGVIHTFLDDPQACLLQMP